MDSSDSPADAAQSKSQPLMPNSTTTTTLVGSDSATSNHDHPINTTESIKLNNLTRSRKSPRGLDNLSDDDNDESSPLKTNKLLKQSSVSSSHQDPSSELMNDIEAAMTAREESNIIVGLKIAIAAPTLLYFFMVANAILGCTCQILSHHHAGQFLKTSGFLQNPLIGLMVGVITTVVFQSSGAVTSVLVTVVGSGVISVRQAIPIIMGANLGTSVTNTVVSLIVFRNKRNFEIAMTAGIVHDMYNMMSVVFLLPIELLFHPHEYVSMWILELLGRETTHNHIGELQFLNFLVQPVVDSIILIDEELTNDLDPSAIVPSDKSLIKRCCEFERQGNDTLCRRKCPSLFSHLDLSDNVVCILLSIIAMIVLFTSLIFVVKFTKSLLGGKLLNWLASLARREYKFPYSAFVGYLFILVGMVITMILHSSGVFTSMLVPLAGGDVLNLMQIYELTLGSNVGTTFTGILAAVSTRSLYPVQTIQIALCHFLFNLFGIFLFYSLPNSTLPIYLSKKFGMYSAKSMWFSICYLVIVFVVAPSLTMAIWILAN